VVKRIVNEICEDLAHEDVVHVHQGQVGWGAPTDVAGAPTSPEHQERLVDQVGHRCRLTPELESA
jgi:hypothetical protein